MEIERAVRMEMFFLFSFQLFPDVCQWVSHVQIIAAITLIKIQFYSMNEVFPADEYAKVYSQSKGFAERACMEITNRMNIN